MLILWCSETGDQCEEDLYFLFYVLDIKKMKIFVKHLENLVEFILEK